MSKKHRFKVSLAREVIVEFNASIMPDDEWRKQFYKSIQTPQHLAEFLAYNYVANGIDRLSQLDGFAGSTEAEAEVAADN